MQVVLLIRQMEATATQAAVAKVSLLTVGQQAIMDAYLCLLHLTTGALLMFIGPVVINAIEIFLLAGWRARSAVPVCEKQVRRLTLAMVALGCLIVLSHVFEPETAGLCMCQERPARQ